MHSVFVFHLRSSSIHNPSSLQELTLSRTQLFILIAGFYNTRKHINFDHEGDWSQFTNLRDTSGNINKIRCFFTKLREVRSFVQIRRKPHNKDRSYNYKYLIYIAGRLLFIIHLKPSRGIHYRHFNRLFIHQTLQWCVSTKILDNFLNLNLLYSSKMRSLLVESLP